MSGYNFHGMSVQDLRDYAQTCRTCSAESFKRCDTDGFLSQAANDVTARVYDLQADLLEDGGLASFPALFDLDGNQVPAVRVDGQYGMCWKLLNPAPGEKPWFGESQARKPGVARMNDAKKGYYVGRAAVPAVADTAGNRVSFWAVIRPVDQYGYTPGEVIDNGIGATNLEEHYKICEM